MLGRDLESLLLKQAVNLFTCSRSPSKTSSQHRVFNLESPGFDALFEWSKADVVFHTAAMTNVDECEKNKERARLVNVGSVSGILECLSRKKPTAKFVYISSDAVKAEGQFMANESCKTGPLNFYGETKLEAERIISDSSLTATAIRTTIVGTRTGIGQNSFSDWVVNSLKSHQKTNLFEDAIFTPISTHSLSMQLVKLLTQDLPKVLNLSGAEAVSKHDFGFKLAMALGLDTGLILKSRISQSGLFATRLKDQTLSSKLAEEKYGLKLPMIEQTIQEVMLSMKNYEIEGIKNV